MIVISQTQSWYLILHFNFQWIQINQIQITIQFPLIIVIVKHVLRNNYYRNTVLVFTPEITATLKVISATTKWSQKWSQPL